MSKLNDQDKALKDLLYVIDGMCDCFRRDNHGEAREWIRHVNDAYSNYEEVVDDK